MKNERLAWVPDDINIDLPNAARVYDYLLGGGHNFAADRTAGAKVLQALPNGRQIASSNRAFLRRAVLYMVEQGITQFLDLGSGIPTVGNVHEVAQKANPMCRVVYVDHDEVAIAHSRIILEGNENATVVAADLCQPATVLGAPAVKRLLDLSKPIGLLMVAVFHFVPNEKDPLGVLAQYRDALPASSLLALSHLTADQMPVGMAAVVEVMKKSRDHMYFRSYDEILAMFDGFELVEPGVVEAPAWRREQGCDDIGPAGVYVGMGRKP
ncbi:MAG TPA: SAM-dependent methyltransferase [Pseudonocardiaceae bacterium]|nr:SAM-dependent methyltransferase [Pseudonocardiaceae bacterium]